MLHPEENPETSPPTTTNPQVAPPKTVEQRQQDVEAAKRAHEQAQNGFAAAKNQRGYKDSVDYETAKERLAAAAKAVDEAERLARKAIHQSKAALANWAQFEQSKLKRYLDKAGYFNIRMKATGVGGTITVNDVLSYKFARLKAMAAGIADAMLNEPPASRQWLQDRIGTWVGGAVYDNATMGGPLMLMDYAVGAVAGDDARVGARIRNVLGKIGESTVRDILNVIVASEEQKLELMAKLKAGDIPGFFATMMAYAGGQIDGSSILSLLVYSVDTQIGMIGAALSGGSQGVTNYLAERFILSDPDFQYMILYNAEIGMGRTPHPATLEAQARERAGRVAESHQYVQALLREIGKLDPEAFERGQQVGALLDEVLMELATAGLAAAAGPVLNRIKSLIKQGFLDEALELLRRTKSKLDEEFPEVELPRINGEVPVRATPDDYRNPKPNTLYESNGYYYRTDSEGRLTEAFGELELGKATRNSYQQGKVGKSSGVPGDEGGHMIGSQFDGLGEGPLHMVSQAWKVNRGAGSAWAAMERKWAHHLAKGDKVTVQLKLNGRRGQAAPTDSL